MLNTILEKIVSNDLLHAKWLNTLSYLENCGARKIAACEHPTLVQSEMLKHAAEEFRHAYFLKQQIKKLAVPFYTTYKMDHLLGGHFKVRYLDRLEVNILRCLKGKPEPYLWITYAIEKRALDIYPHYQQLLKQRGSPVTVKPLIAEEHQHLEEMIAGLSCLPNWKETDHQIQSIENGIFNRWIEQLNK